MKKRKKNPAAFAKVLLLAAVSFTLPLVSCIGEDLEGCDWAIPVTVSLLLDPEEETGQVTAGEVATIYIFDAEGGFVDRESIEAPVFGEPYLLNKRIAKGTYHFVVWVNPTEPYSVHLDLGESQAQKHTATLRLNLPVGEDNIEADLPVLFHGKADQREITRAAGTDVVELPLRQNTNRIQLTVKGLSRSADTYLFSIADNNGAYDFDNNHVDHQTFNYRSRAAFQTGADHLESALTVLRLGEARAPQLAFANHTTGQTLYPSYEGQEANLVKLIRAAYDGRWIDFDRRHTFEVELTFDANLQATVTIDGWKVKDEGHEL